MKRAPMKHQKIWMIAGNILIVLMIAGTIVLWKMSSEEEAENHQAGVKTISTNEKQQQDIEETFEKELAEIKEDIREQEDKEEINKEELPLKEDLEKAEEDEAKKGEKPKTAEDHESRDTNQQTEKPVTSKEKPPVETANKPSATPNETAEEEKSAESENKNTIPTNGSRLAEVGTDTGFIVIREDDPNLPLGETKTVQKGQTGYRIDTFKETYKNGVMVDMQFVSSKVIKEPVNEIIKIGTKETNPSASYLSAAEAKTILRSAGVFTEYPTVFEISNDFGSVINVTIGSGHVERITYNGTSYLSFGGGTLEELVELLGPEEGKIQYEYGQAEMRKIEKAVQAATDALYGKGTSKSKALYNRIINSANYAQDF